MTLDEIGTIALCLFGGYWGVSFLMNRKPRKPDAGDATGSPPPPDETLAPRWPEILGVAETAAMDEIRQAYKQRIAEYHPDKVATLGPELRELAERKSKEINVAYDEARRARGEPA